MGVGARRTWEQCVRRSSWHAFLTTGRRSMLCPCAGRFERVERTHVCVGAGVTGGWDGPLVCLCVGAGGAAVPCLPNRVHVCVYVEG